MATTISAAEFFPTTAGPARDHMRGDAALSPAEKAQECIAAVVRDRRLTPAERIAACEILARLQLSGIAELAADAIAKSAGVSKRKVQDAVGRLEELGYLHVQRHPGGQSLYALPDTPEIAAAVEGAR
jgi:hypothetical protein